MHRNLMRIFRLYMLIGGMPQAIEVYIEKNNLQLIDEVKREIVDLYEEDFVKIDGSGLAGDIYNKLLSDKLDANLGYVYENVVAQMLIAKGDNLFYYTMESETSNHLYEIDFVTSVGDKISPLEVKSCNYRTHKSLDVFCDKFSNRVWH